MKGLFFISLFLYTVLYSFGQEEVAISNCNFKTGEFYVLKGVDTCYISRSETRQKEICAGSDQTYELIVVWLKDKKYILRDIHYNPTTTPRVMRKDVVMHIVEVGKDYHVVLIKAQGQKDRRMTVYCRN